MHPETALDIRVTRVTAPSAEPLTLEQVKIDRVIDYDDHDSLLTDAIKAAREVAEQITGRALMPQQWQQLHPSATAELSLMVWPAVSIESISIDGETIDHAT
ncbi:head-tail connector protein, partial [Wenyingzhuangia sp. 1_MG-2023]|nr:head-tail connector protein [Wenyingzhuangia sp. 1_MG-2023]